MLANRMALVFFGAGIAFAAACQPGGTGPLATSDPASSTAAAAQSGAGLKGATGVADGNTGYIPATVAGGNTQTANRPKPGSGNSTTTAGTTTSAGTTASPNTSAAGKGNTTTPANGNAPTSGNASAPAGNTNATAGDGTGGNNTTASSANAAGVTPVAWASLDFVDNPGGNDPAAFVLTFDDGPDGRSGYGGINNTNYILDQLKTLGVPGAFFVCSKVWTDMATDSLAQTAIQRMLAEGHEVANHTYDHQYLTALSVSQAGNELANNQQILWSSGAMPSGQAMSMYRATYGAPFQADASQVSWLAPVTAPYGVHIGWSLDSNDWSCAQNGQEVNCIVDNINAQLDRGQSGIILMHAVYRLSGDALPLVVAAVQARGGHFVTLESMVQAKYGASSAQIMAANAKANFTASQMTAAAQKACGVNNQHIDPPYPNAASMAGSKK